MSRVMLIWVTLTSLMLTLLLPLGNVHATSFVMRPLIYDDVLKTGEKKRGFVDISNPSGATLELKTSIQAFRQINDQGGLEFFDNEHVSSGILLDLDSFTLKPHETLRLYFLIDGARLPEGDVFAAVFVSTVPEKTSGASVSVRVGTLLIIKNGTATSHKADIESLEASVFQFGEAITTRMYVRNVADEKAQTGFFPEITVALQPYTAKSATGPLVFAGRTRTIDYREIGNYFGPIRIDAGTGDSHKTRIIFAVTGYWRWLAPLILVLISFLAALFKRRYSKH